MTTPVTPAADAPSRVDTYEGMCFVLEADSDVMSDAQLTALNLKLKDQFPPGVLAILELTVGADSDDVDAGREQKAFVHVELQVTPAISGRNPARSGVLALLDLLALELNKDFVVEREDWILDDSVDFELDIASPDSACAGLLRAATSAQAARAVIQETNSAKRPKA